jgi:hypothetical protein
MLTPTTGVLLLLVVARLVPLFCLFVCLFVEDGSGECCVSLSARIAVEMGQSSCIWMYVFFFFLLFFFFYSFCA